MFVIHWSLGDVIMCAIVALIALAFGVLYVLAKIEDALMTLRLLKADRKRRAAARADAERGERE
jgi:hypothetical protein